MKKWNIAADHREKEQPYDPESIIQTLLKNRKLETRQQIEEFISPKNPQALTADEIGIDKTPLSAALKRIQTAVQKREMIVVYADYDADGITAGAIMWETLHNLGASVMPYIPHRVEEGYGLSIAGIDKVNEQYSPNLIITVDHGITAEEKVAYAKSLGIDVIVTDHHVKPDRLPECVVVHTTQLCGAGVSWFVARELINTFQSKTFKGVGLIELAAIGTIADMVPLIGPNRSIVKSGLSQLNKTERVGLEALIYDAGLIKGKLGTYDVSHILAPRLNAMGRLDHALDALRLLCTKNSVKAGFLARKLGLTNQERQQMTQDTTAHALQGLAPAAKDKSMKKLLFVSHESYNQGVIGLVAGKLVEEYYRPAIVVSVGETFSKASARSVNGFNIVEAIRSCTDILVDVGGHPMAAGFTVETRLLTGLKSRLEALAEKEIDVKLLTRTLSVDLELPLDAITSGLWERLRDFEPFGFGNLEPVFVSRKIKIIEMRTVGNGNKHLKLRLEPVSYSARPIDAIAFGFGNLTGQIAVGDFIDIAYSVAEDTWNGNNRLQLKIKDIHTQ